MKYNVHVRDTHCRGEQIDASSRLNICLITTYIKKRGLPTNQKVFSHFFQIKIRDIVIEKTAEVDKQEIAEGLKSQFNSLLLSKY